MSFVKKEDLVAQFEKLLQNDCVMNPIITVLNALEIINKQPTIDTVELPYYIGQKMWYPRAWYNFNDKEVRSELYEGKVSMLQQKADGSWKIRVSTRWELDYKVEDIGKDVFLTREAAEADLNKQIKFLKEKYNLE